MVPSAAALMRKSHKLVARNRSGLRMLAKVFATAVLGLLGLIFLHPALQPLAAVIMGGAMVAFNLIGVDCDEGLFFRSTMLNAAVGGAVAAVCGPVELISKSLVSTSIVLKRIVCCCSNDDAHSMHNTPLLSTGLLIAAAAYTLQAQSLIFLKCWILPICLMHVMIRSIVLDGDTATGSSRRLLFFPELVGVWGTETNKTLQAKAVVAKTSTATENVPLYRLPLAIKELWLAQGWKRGDSSKESQSVSRCRAFVVSVKRLPLVVTRELLFWRKRDTLLWIVMGACCVLGALERQIPAKLPSLNSLVGVLPVFPLLVIVPFLLWKSRAAKAVDYTYLAVLGKQSASTAFLGLGLLSCSPATPSDMFRYEATEAFVAAQENEAAIASLHSAKVRQREAEQLAADIAADPFYPELTETKDGGCCGTWTMDQIRWPMAIYIVGVHALAVVGLNWLRWAKPQTLLFAFILWPITGFGITGGAHRLWAHRSYEAAPLARWIMMVCASMANQGTVFHWARDHRTHHRHSETPSDPHNARRGFFFAHVGWLLLKKDPRVKIAGRKVDVSDLAADSALALQRKLDPFWNLFWCFVFPMLVAHYAWGETFACGYFVPGVLRYVWVLNSTWCVNSAAHLWGDHPYDPRSNPAENSFVSIVAIGEGWHNWHHAFPFDYAASELGISSQWNPTKLTIDAFAKFGLVSNRKRAHKQWAKRAARLEPEFKKLFASETATPAVVGAPLFRRRRWQK